jgi:hypothetical protein
MDTEKNPKHFGFLGSGFDFSKVLLAFFGK